MKSMFEGFSYSESYPVGKQNITFPSTVNFLNYVKDWNDDYAYLFGFSVSFNDKDEPELGYYAVFVYNYCHKGIMATMTVENYDPRNDDYLLLPYLKEKWEKVKSRWRPISDGDFNELKGIHIKSRIEDMKKELKELQQELERISE